MDVKPNDFAAAAPSRGSCPIRSCPRMRASSLCHLFWVPACAGTNGIQARVIAPVLCFLAARGGRHPGLRRAFFWSPARMPRGRRADRRDFLQVRALFPQVRRLSARHHGVFPCCAGPRFLRTVSFLPGSGRTRLMGVSPGRGLRNPGQTVERSAVSELLAGTRSGPGRCPGAARVRGYEPRPRAPRSRGFPGPARNAPVAVLRHHPHPACSIIETSRDDALSRARRGGIWS